MSSTFSPFFEFFFFFHFSCPYEMLVFNLAITVFSISMSISSYIFSSTYIRLKLFFKAKQRPLFKECGYMLHLDGLKIDLVCYLGRDDALFGDSRVAQW